MEPFIVNESLTEDTVSKYAQEISVADADEQFGISEEVNFPYPKFSDKQKTYVISGDVTVDEISVSKQDWSPFNLIIDGNLTVLDTIDWSEWGNGSFLYVTGNMTAKNVFLAGCPEVIVKGDLKAENGIVGSQGDNGGSLIVLGDTSAKLIYCTTYFGMDFAERPEAFIIAAEYDFMFDVDLNESDCDAVAEKIAAECQPDDEGEMDVHVVKEFLRAGKSIFVS
ncbi:hypothetical protein D3C87_84850 [compost metagenome]